MKKANKNLFQKLCLIKQGIYLKDDYMKKDKLAETLIATVCLSDFIFNNVDILRISEALIITGITTMLVVFG